MFRVRISKLTGVLLLSVAGVLLLSACTGSDNGRDDGEAAGESLAELRAENRELKRENASLEREVAATEHGAGAADEAAGTHTLAVTGEESGGAEHGTVATNGAIQGDAEAGHGAAEGGEEDHGGSTPHWTYAGADGPSAWGDLSPVFATCASGEEQSPINISSTTRVGLTDIAFHYAGSDLTVVNNGHTIQANVDPGSYIELDDSRYNLAQFHWHVPSEHEVNEEHFAMEMHFVHVGLGGTLAVVGVLFESGANGDALDPIWSVMPESAGGEASVDAFEIETLLPHGRTAYRYMGSLTTPPLLRGREMVGAARGALGLRRADGCVLGDHRGE